MFGELSLHFDTIVLLGMILACVFNLFFYLLKFTHSKSLLITSAVMAASYFISNHFFEAILYSQWRFAVWLTFDIVTIGLDRKSVV